MGISTLISTSTADDADSIDITSGIDSTYDEYMFVFTDINPVNDGARLGFQVNAVGQTGYNEVMTTTFFHAWHYESGSSSGVAYQTSTDQAQGTAYQALVADGGNLADECSAGIFHLFAPSSATYVKHFYARIQLYCYPDISRECYTAGYVNATTVVDAIQFKMNGGNFDGTIKMYGLL